MKKILTLLMLIAAAIPLWAEDFTVDGIYYNISDATNKTVEVTYQGSSYYSYSDEYTGTVVIPESVSYNGTTYSVTSIGMWAFRDCTGLTSITIPESVTSIGYGAFEGCMGLTSVTIPNSVTSIGECAFRGCTGLTEITIPESVTWIGREAFYETPYYNNMPDGVIYLGKVLYKYKGTMPANTTINIKDGTTAITGDAFYKCTGLTEITIPESVTSIGNYAFTGCTELKKLIIADGEETLSLGYNYYYSAGIGEGLFYDCPIDMLYLGRDLSYNSSRNYGSSPFRNRTTLKSLTIGNSVTSIGNDAFSGCTGLTSITIPNSVTSIGEHAFSNCTGLTSITIPNSVTSIGGSAFNRCTGLTSVTIGNSVTSIGEWAFYECTGLTSITIPNSVTSIGGRAFYQCTGLTEITIPNSVTSIGDYAFLSCTGLTEVTIGSGVTEIGSGAFAGCEGLTLVTIGNSVTEIGSNAFSGCTGLTSITIPNSVTSIGERAFYQCTGLTEITCLAQTPPTIGGSNTFYNVTKSIPVYVPAGSVETYQAASQWSEFTNIKAGKIEIDGIYYEVTAADEVAVTYYGTYEFNVPDEYEYTGSVVIPESVTYNDVTYNVTSIGNSAFYECTGLTSVTIGNSVTSIGANAFYQCTGLTEITCLAATPPTIGGGPFSGVDKSIPLYVPDGSVETYQAAEYWSEFTNIVAHITDNRLAGDDVTVASVNGELLLESFDMPIRIVNTADIAGLQFDIHLPAGLAAEQVNNSYVISLSSALSSKQFSASSSLLSNGGIRVVIVTFTINNFIEAGESELLTLRVTPTADYEANSPIVIKNVVMTGSDYTEYNSSQGIFYTRISESISGDTNLDKSINVTDVVSIAEYLQGNEPAIFDLYAADDNQDGTIDEADLTSVASAVVAGERAGTANEVVVEGETPNQLSLASVEFVELDGVMSDREVLLPVSLTNPTELTALQCDIELPAGINAIEEASVVKITGSDRLAQDHVISSAWQNNGTLRVVIYSPQSTAFTAGEGELFSVSVQANANFESGSTITIRNITLVGLDATEYNSAETTATTTLKQSTTGDINRDDNINVTDVVISVNYILNNYDSAYDEDAADVVKDSQINVNDVVALINLILRGDDIPSAPEREVAEKGILSMPDVTMGASQMSYYAISLDNEAPYTAFQMDITLPEGLSIADMRMSERASSTHQLHWNDLGDGRVRLIGLSMTNQRIAGTSGEIVELTLVTTANYAGGTITLCDNIFTTRGLTSHNLETVEVGAMLPQSVTNVEGTTEIYVIDRTLVIEVPEAQTAGLTTTNGVLQHYELQAGRNEISLSQQGVYVVTVGAQSKKVVVK